MNDAQVPDTVEILAARPAKNPVDPTRPYHMLVEDEPTADGRIEPVATVFLTNRECPYRCLMCDLWKNTLDEALPPGVIPRQIEYALERLPPVSHIKLYNSGNFFDPRAIPPADHEPIARQLAGFETVIVENHPRMCTAVCGRFARMLDGQLEVALGLETVHPHVLPRLNKNMTVDDFRRAAGQLREQDIALRVFLLLKPPYLSAAEGLEWTLQSLDVAFAAGARCCAIIPTRAGNGIMEQLQRRGDFAPPNLRLLEQALVEGLRRSRGRVLVDLWDAAQFASCDACADQRVDRLRQMNLQQRVLPASNCPQCGAGSEDQDEL